MLLLIFFWDYLNYSWLCWPLGGTYTHGDLETGTAPYSAECVEKLFDKSLEDSRRIGLAVLKVAKWCLLGTF